MSGSWKLAAAVVVATGVVAGTWLVLAPSPGRNGVPPGRGGDAASTGAPAPDTTAGGELPVAGVAGEHEERPGATPPTPASPAELARSPAIRYRVLVRRPAAGTPPAWHVVQGPDVASLIPPGDPPELEHAWAVTGTAVGGWPHVVDREGRTLNPVWDTTLVYRPDVAVERRMSRVSYRELTYDLRRGDADRDSPIAGQPARHYVLEVRFRAVARGRGAMATLSPDTATASVRSDLWFAPDLSFSWAPLAAWGAQGVAAGQEPLDNFLRLRLVSRLRELGLPVRAVTRIRYETPRDQDFSFPPDSRTEMVVESLQPASLPAAVPEYLEYARRSSLQAPRAGSSSSLRSER